MQLFRHSQFQLGARNFEFYRRRLAGERGFDRLGGGGLRVHPFCKRSVIGPRRRHLAHFLLLRQTIRLPHRHKSHSRITP